MNKNNICHILSLFNCIQNIFGHALEDNFRLFLKQSCGDHFSVLETPFESQSSLKASLRPWHGKKGHPRPLRLSLLLTHGRYHCLGSRHGGSHLPFSELLTGSKWGIDSFDVQLS